MLTPTHTTKMRNIHTREYLEGDQWVPLSEPWNFCGIMGYPDTKQAQREMLKRNSHLGAIPYKNGVEYIEIIPPFAGVEGGTFRHRIWFEDVFCRICGWPLAESVRQGCVPGNCSYKAGRNDNE